ncbi:hypothetical protein DPMN_025832 [Dreissena polymorpha]|uniref:Uncharacterized protein n=1 Tax=Dreissena polymorpha TaxID=45954 RepID=A0A9D4LSB0_DREPO|nr:hypothetical protein DPMN_025832 [Dreissena polymorpha]
MYGKTGNFESANSFFRIDANNGTVTLIKDLSQDGLYAQRYNVRRQRLLFVEAKSYSCN